MTTPPHLASSASADAAANPFLALRSRYILALGALLMVVMFAGSVYVVLAERQLVPAVSDDPILTPVSLIVFWTLLAIAIFRLGQQQNLNVRYLFGQNRPQFSVAFGVLLVLSLLLFSLGISATVLYLLSLKFPGYVSQLLASSNILDGDISAYPAVYEMLMLFLVLVYAPLVEEIVFRGILLQRWGQKWGIRSGVIASSVLFGVLHLNNPVGLTLFGLAMALLYVKTQSLWVPIGCHALNNLAAVGIDWLSKVTAGGQTTTVSDIQELWWISLIPIAVSLPFLVWFVWRSWPHKTEAIPYVANASRVHPKSVG